MYSLSYVWPDIVTVCSDDTCGHIGHVHDCSEYTHSCLPHNALLSLVSQKCLFSVCCEFLPEVQVSCFVFMPGDLALVLGHQSSLVTGILVYVLGTRFRLMSMQCMLL